MKLIKTPSILLFLFLLLSSCLNNLDFDNIDIDHNPVLNGPFLSFTLNQTDFFDSVNNVENLTITTVVGEFDILQSDDVSNNLVRAEFDMIISNQFNRNLTVIIDFLDEFDNFTHRAAPFTVVAGNTNFFTEIDISVVDNPAFLRTRRVSVEIRMTASSTMLDPTIPREISFKSSGKYFLNL